MVHLLQACWNGMSSGCIGRGGEQEEKEWETWFCSLVFRIPTHFSPSYFWHHLFSSFSLFVVIAVVRHIFTLHKYTYTFTWFYTYTFRINSSFVSVITSQRIMFYNLTNIHIWISLVFFSLYMMMLFDLQGYKSQCEWLTKKKNVKDNICLYTYSRHKQQVIKKMWHPVCLSKYWLDARDKGKDGICHQILRHQWKQHIRLFTRANIINNDLRLAVLVVVI